MPRRDVSAERTAQILDAAEKVFARSGFFKARIDDVAEATGMSKGLVYRYFGSKDKLILALMRRNYAAQCDELDRLIDQPGAAEARLVSFLLPVLETSVTKRVLLRSLSHDFLALADRSAEIREGLHAFYKAFHSRIAVILRQGVERGEIRPLDPELLSHALGASLAGSFLVSPMAQTDADMIVAQIHLVLDAFFRGIRASSS